MNTFKIPESLYPKYQGAGYALAATLNGELINIVYIEDVLNIEIETDTQMKEALKSDSLGHTVRELQALGEVHAGMCSCYEFVEL